MVSGSKFDSKSSYVVSSTALILIYVGVFMQFFKLLCSLFFAFLNILATFFTHCLGHDFHL